MLTIASGLITFLHAAKLATYAARGDAARVEPLLPDSKQLEYVQGNYLYRDIFVGVLHFIGQEVVYCEGQARWSMAYAGGLLASVPRPEAQQIYRVLRGALSGVPRAVPVRGPAVFELEGLRYTCALNGDLQRFDGTELIERGAERLYALHFAGGGTG